jgi:ribosomal protein L2
LQINYNYRYNKFAIISSFQFIPFQNKLISLLLFANGAASYINTSERHKIFSYFFIGKRKKTKHLRFRNILFMIFQIKKLSLVSLIELYPGKNAQYARGSGTFSKIIKFDVATHTVLLELPSGIKKIFSYYSYVFLGRVALR